MEYNKYNDGLIYKIWFGNIIYIGSTTNLESRINRHKTGYKRFKNGNHKFVGSFTIFDLTDDYQYEEIEKYPCNSELELLARERQHILYYKNNNEWTCCNKYIPTGTMISPTDNKKEYQKEYDKKYYQHNLEKKIQRGKEHYQNNKEKIKQRSKEIQKKYRLNNRDEINRKARERYKEKKEIKLMGMEDINKN